MASFPPIDIVPLVNRIAAVLRERKQTITISESVSITASSHLDRATGRLALHKHVFIWFLCFADHTVFFLPCLILVSIPKKKTKNCLLPGDTVLIFLFTVYFMTRVANSSRRAAAWFRRTWCRSPVHPSTTTAAPSHTHSNRDWSLAAGPTRTSTHIRKIFLTIHYRGLFTNFFFFVFILANVNMSHCGWPET